MDQHLEMEPTNGQPRPELPRAERERWQPIRGGLLNLYRYDYEEFRYEQGHLLLRGNNGTGKSRVLALQLPFLLDGEVAPHRLEPDGDPAKRIDWNLLLGKYSERQGYTWLEFGRLDDDGQEHYLTLGCGLRAVEGRGLTGRWYFITSQRVGRDLYLQSRTGQALTRERLVESIGESGQVFTTAASYRQAVDRALFKLGEHRYEALVSLLIQLRQPQLSRQLDEKKLSAALSEALPPIAANIVADVAESFRSLEADRNTLEAFAAASRGADAFLTHYRRYAQIAARRRAEAVRAAHSAYESTMRKLRAAEVDQREAEAALKEAANRMEQLAIAERAAGAAVQTLAESPQMQDAKALDAARRLADERRDAARQAADDHRHASLAAEQLERARQLDAQAAGAAWQRAEEALRQAREPARSAGLDRTHRETVAPLERPEAHDLAQIGRAGKLLESAASQRRQAARHVRELNRQVEVAAAALASAKEAQTSLATQLDEGLELQRLARTALDRASAALVDAYQAWAGSVVELSPADIDALREPFWEWCQVGQGPSPIAEAISSAAAEAARKLSAVLADAQQRLTAATADLHELQAQYEWLLAGHHQPPPSPHTRDEQRRAERLGAALWAACDFASEIDEPVRAGVEAALEAAGLLDAWITPEGRLLDPHEFDTVLVAGTSPRPPDDRHLGKILVPAIDRADPRAAALADGVVSAVLAHIGFGADSGAVWVDAQGRWQAGPLHGSWAKPAAQHIGQGAREAARRRRLEQLAGEIAAAERAVESVQAEIEQFRRRERTAERERTAAPDDGAVRRALADIDAAAGHVHRLRNRLAEAEARAAQRRRELTETTDRRDRDAHDLGVADWVNNLPGLEDAISSYLQALAGLWPALGGHIEARRRADAAAEQAVEALGHQQRRAELLHEAQQRAEVAAAERDTLESSVGAAAEEILARLAAARRQAEQVRSEREQAVGLHADIKVREALAQKEIQNQSETLEHDMAHREAAIASLARFAATRLLSVAIAELDETDPAGWSATRAVDVARRIETDLANIDHGDAAWDRNQKEIHRHIQELTETLLPQGYQPVTSMDDGILVVTAPFQGRDCTMAELRQALSDEVTMRQSLLDAREREVLENHLIGEVATHLHERLHAAEELVHKMNLELHARPMSTGLTLRFTWRPVEDGPAGLAEARGRLLRAGGTWSPAERESLGAFLQQQIRLVRAASDAGTWQDHLSAALDYRAWHQFGVERQQDGQWKRLTRRTHGTGSGGEKAIALTIPQFAAAAAHYRTADPQAPRLILLDEAFVGVDADMRSKCMGLLHAFDLDFVMTSEREWGCYATMPGVAIYQLATRPGIDAVGVTRWLWNGRERVRADEPLPSAFPPAEQDAQALSE